MMPSAVSSVSLPTVSIQPLRSALARSASVKSMVLTPGCPSQSFLFLAVTSEPLRSALVRLALAKSTVVSLCVLAAVSDEPLRLAFARLASSKSMVAG